MFIRTQCRLVTLREGVGNVLPPVLVTERRTKLMFSEPTVQSRPMKGRH